MKIYSLLLISFFFFIPFLLIGQNLKPRIIPSSEFTNSSVTNIVYDIETDSRGLLYMATSAGIQYFSGGNMKNEKIKRSKDLTNTYYAIQKDYNGELWFSSEYGISYLKKDSLLSYPVPDSLLIMGRGFESVYQDEKGLLHLAPRAFGYCTVDSLGNVTEIMTRRETNIRGFVVTQLEDGSWFHFSILSKYSVEHDMSIYFLNEDNELLKITDTEDKKPIYQSALVQHADSSFSISMGTTTIVRFRENHLIDKHLTDDHIIKLFVDSKNDLWIGTYEGGLFQAKNSDLNNLLNYESEMPISMLAESYDGGLWCSSRSIGFGNIPPHSFLNYSVYNGNAEINSVHSVNVIDNKILVTSGKDEFYFLDKNKLTPIKIPVETSNLTTKNSTYNRIENILWFPANDAIHGLNLGNGKIESIDTKTYGLKNKNFRDLKTINNRILGITKNDYFEIKNDELEVIASTSDFELRDFCITSQGEIYFATNNGEVQLKDDIFIEISSNTVEDQNLDLYSTFFAQNQLWAIGIDLKLFKRNNGIFEEVLDQNNTPVKLFAYNLSPEGDIWGLNGENYTLIRIRNSTHSKNVMVTEYELPRYCVESMTKLGIAVLNETIYIGTDYGLFEQKVENLLSTPIETKVVFDIAINNKNVDFDTLYNLDYWEKDILIEFDAINFEQTALTYSCRMDGYDSTWTDTEFTQQRYTNLAPGLYQYNLRVKSGRGAWGKTHSIIFNIVPPYWQTWWFRITIILAVLLVIYLIIRLRIKQVRKKEREKLHVALELNRLEMRALKAQINPHFIFNSITSAMLHLSKKEYEKTEFYLDGFAKLLRQVLENSDQSLVKLGEEMELMSQYVKIESEHFDGEPISFDIVYDEIDPEEMHIQPTLLQPYIENSIHHGLKSKIGKRIIRIVFRLNKKELEVQIEDNGIGRKAAKASGFYKDYKSYGMFISAKRIELLNKINFSGVHIDDLENEKGEAMGTRIRFKIPVP